MRQLDDEHAAAPSATRLQEITARLVGETDGELGTWYEQCCFGAGEAHDLFFVVMERARCVCGGCDELRHDDALAAARKWREYRWTVVYNPLYWLLWAPMVALIVAGRRLHYVFGQHDKVRRDESFIEREVRTWWIYACDAGFLGGFLLTVIDTVVYALDGKIGDFLAWSGLVITTCCYLPYIGANVLFLAAMRRRSAPHVKACIAGNIALAIVMAALLVFTIIRYANDEVPESIAKFASAHSLIYLAAIWCADHRWHSSKAG